MAERQLFDPHEVDSPLPAELLAVAPVRDDGGIEVQMMSGDESWRSRRRGPR